MDIGQVDKNFVDDEEPASEAIVRMAIGEVRST